MEFYAYQVIAIDLAPQFIIRPHRGNTTTPPKTLSFNRVSMVTENLSLRSCSHYSVILTSLQAPTSWRWSCQRGLCSRPWQSRLKAEVRRYSVLKTNKTFNVSWGLVCFHMVPFHDSELWWAPWCCQSHHNLGIAQIENNWEQTTTQIKHSQKKKLSCSSKPNWKKILYFF
jgi:hypothetical protein